jgi:hypothetical protein
MLGWTGVVPPFPAVVVEARAGALARLGAVGADAAALKGAALLAASESERRLRAMLLSVC